MKIREGRQDFTDKIIPDCCPKCSSKKLCKYGKDKFDNQKYQCHICKHQFVPTLIKKSVLANILLAPNAASLHFFITIMMITQIIVVLITISDCGKRFATVFHSKMLTLMLLMNFDSDE